MVSANFSHLCPPIDGCENQIYSEQREMIFLNLRLDSKEFAAFLRVSKHFEKMIQSQLFDVKRVCKVGKPCLFTSCVGDPRVGRAIYFKARAISHFLVTRSHAVRKLYEATLRWLTTVFQRLLFFAESSTHARARYRHNARKIHASIKGKPNKNNKHGGRRKNFSNNFPFHALQESRMFVKFIKSRKKLPA